MEDMQVLGDCLNVMLLKDDEFFLHLFLYYIERPYDGIQFVMMLDMDQGCPIEQST